MHRSKFTNPKTVFGWSRHTGEVTWHFKNIRNSDPVSLPTQRCSTGDGVADCVIPDSPLSNSASAVTNQTLTTMSTRKKSRTKLNVAEALLQQKSLDHTSKLNLSFGADSDSDVSDTPSGDYTNSDPLGEESDEHDSIPEPQAIPQTMEQPFIRKPLPELSPEAVTALAETGMIELWNWFQIDMDNKFQESKHEMVSV